MSRRIERGCGCLEPLLPSFDKIKHPLWKPPMKPSVVLDMKRIAVREAVSRFRTANPRVFGSVLHGTDRDGSDLDLLVDTLPGATLLDLGDLEEELKSLLGVNVDLLTPGDLPAKFRAKVLAEARPV
jgi:predicted nucleotidyltransferase